MSAQRKSEDPNYEFSSKDNWELWCRLCAKEDEQENTSVFSNDKTQNTKKRGSDESNLQAAIKKYFLVNITRREDLPKVVCTDCVALITSLVNFTVRVSKVQQMFRIIRNSNEISKLDLNSLRLKYDIRDKKQENLLGKQKLPEIYCDMSIAKVTEMEVDNFDTDETDANEKNPLEITLPKLKFENDDQIEHGEMYDDENATDNDSLNDEGVDDFESTQKVISKPCRKTKKHARVARNNRRNELKTITSSRQNIPKDTIPCIKCPLRFKSLKNFHHHMNRVHADVAELSDIVCKDFEFRCGECSRVFPSQIRLEGHSRTHLPIELKKIIPCEYCNKKFTTNQILQTHVNNVHINDRRFICEECGAPMQTKDALKGHMVTHTDYAPFECDICEKGFKNQKRLKRHMGIHDPDKYACPECGLKLSSRGTLKHHLIVHSDEMRHKCDYCGRAFKRIKTLKAHLIIHSGLNPYSCNFCDSTFTTGFSCRLHKKTAHPEELAAVEAATGKDWRQL